MSKKSQLPQNENNDTPINELSHDDLAMLLEYFSNGMNGTRAWMETHPNSQYNSARASAAEWLAKPNIKSEVTRLLNEKAMSMEEALARTSDIARASLMPFVKVDNDGFTYFNFADPEAKEHMHIIKKMKTKRERRVVGFGEKAEDWEGEWVEVELHDAQTAQRDLLKMYGKFVDKMEHTGKDGTPLISKVDNEKFDRALSTLSEALSSIIEKEKKTPATGKSSGE